MKSPSDPLIEQAAQDLAKTILNSRSKYDTAWWDSFILTDLIKICRVALAAARAEGEKIGLERAAQHFKLSSRVFNYPHQIAEAIRALPVPPEGEK